MITPLLGVVFACFTEDPCISRVAITGIDLRSVNSAPGLGVDLVGWEFFDVLGRWRRESATVEDINYGLERQWSHVEKCASVFGGVTEGRKGSGSGSSAGNVSEKQKNGQAVAGIPNWTKGHDGVSNTGQAANPAGFKAWSSFTGKKRAGEDGGDLHKGRAVEATGEVSPTNEQKIDAKKWAVGVTWNMIVAELESLPVTTEDEEGSDGAT
ncbi:hypothetical protein R1sor_009760 [Riccia sorocarpa]|uniref:Uncharacterized protein n=1 Tax=Riccia sorocarpa TaxID=122646 RepID=A0ABD3HZE9_9MARC